VEEEDQLISTVHRRLLYAVTSPELESSIRAFMRSYATAFRAGDPAAILEHFSKTVCFVTDEGGSISVDTIGAAGLRKLVHRLAARYRDLGVDQVHLRFQDVVPISAQLTAVKIAWALRGRNGAALHDFDALYTLSRRGTAHRIVAVAHDEMARIRRRSA
jgi:hypothetical protein